MLLALPDRIWIGLSDEELEGRFLWLDGSEDIENEAMWALGEPNDSDPGEDCAVILAHFYGLMNDIPCSYAVVGLCEKKYEP